MTLRAALVPALLATLILPSPASLHAQGILRLEPLHGDIGIGYDGRLNASEAPSSSRTQVLREWIGVRVAGSVVDPGLAQFHLNLRPAFSQGWWSGTGFEGTDTGGRQGLFGDAMVQLFSTGPVSLNARVFRSRDIIESRFDQRTETDSEGFVVSGNFRSKYLNVNAVYDESESDGVFTSLVSSPGRRYTDRKQFMLVAQNSKTRVRYQRLERDDLLRVDDEYLRHQLIGTNDQRWGKGSNLRSRVGYTLQEGTGSTETLNLGQSVHLQHTGEVATNLNWFLNNSQTRFDDARGWGASLTETVRPSRSVMLSLTGGFEGRSFTAGNSGSWRVMPRAQFTHELTPGMLFSAGGGLGYQYRSQENAEDGFGTAVGERHVVPQSLRFLLGQPMIDPTSVRLISEDALIAFEQGFDYRLNASGPFLEVIALPGGRMLSGTVVLADYRFELLPTADGGILRWEYNLSLAVGGLQVYHSLSGDQKQGQTETEVPLFGETDNAIAGIRYDTESPIGNLHFDGEWRRTAFDGIASQLYAVNASTGFSFARQWRGGAGIGWSSRRDGTRWDMFRGYGKLIWTPIPRLNVTGTLSAHQWERDIGGSERFIGAAVGADWTVRQLTAGIRYEHNAYVRNLDRSENRLMIRISRAF